MGLWQQGCLIVTLSLLSSLWCRTMCTLSQGQRTRSSRPSCDHLTLRLQDVHKLENLLLLSRLNAPHVIMISGEPVR